MYVRCAMNRWYSRINYVHSPDGETSAGVSGNNQTMHTGFSAYTYCIMPTPRC